MSCELWAIWKHLLSVYEAPVPKDFEPVYISSFFRETHQFPRNSCTCPSFFHHQHFIIITLDAHAYVTWIAFWLQHLCIPIRSMTDEALINPPTMSNFPLKFCAAFACSNSVNWIKPKLLHCPVSKSRSNYTSSSRPNGSKICQKLKFCHIEV